MGISLDRHSPVVKHGNGNPVCIAHQIWNTECSLADEMCAQWKVLTEEISIPSGKAMFLMLETSLTPEVRIAPKGLPDHNLSTTCPQLVSLNAKMNCIDFGWF